MIKEPELNMTLRNIIIELKYALYFYQTGKQIGRQIKRQGEIASNTGCHLANSVAQKLQKTYGLDMC